MRAGHSLIRWSPSILVGTLASGAKDLKEDLLSVRAGRNLPMEGVRGLAVLLVFFVHFHFAIGTQASPGSTLRYCTSSLAEIGHSGVDLFFLLSGYLIYSNVTSSKFRMKRFWLRRIQRLYPTFLAVFLCYLIIYQIVPSRSKLPQGTWPSLVYLAQNVVMLPGLFDIKPVIYVAWSLSYEMAFYVLISFAGLATRSVSTSRTWRVLALTTIAATYLWLTWSHGNLVWSGIRLAPFSHPRMIMFLAGMVLLEFQDRFRLTFNPARQVVAVAAFAFALALPALGILSAFGDQLRAAALWTSGIFFCGYAFSESGLIARWLSCVPLRILGNISYSFYLIHSLVINGAGEIVRLLLKGRPISTMQCATVFPMALALAIAASLALFVLVERRLSLSKHRPILNLP